MKKIISIIVIIIILIIYGIVLLSNKETEEVIVLYTAKYEDVTLRFIHVDDVAPQNQIVAVQKSINNGKSFKTITEGQVIVSLEPRFVFVSEEIGFAISKSNLSKSNNYMGIQVTQDGGKTFKQAIINYDNPNIDILTIEGVPYMEEDILKLPCSIYQINKKRTDYETVNLIFISKDNGLTWNLENN